jgi:S1-C subfamily serine protease
MTADSLDKLIGRARSSANGTTVKARTLLKTFGYSRRSPENVLKIREALAARGIECAISMDAPVTLDERVSLLFRTDPTRDPEPTVAPAAAESSTDAPVQRADDGQKDAPETPARVIAAESMSPAVNAIAVGRSPALQGIADSSEHATPDLTPPTSPPTSEAHVKAEPPRSLARRLVRAARRFFWEEAPARQVREGNAPSGVAASTGPRKSPPTTTDRAPASNSVQERAAQEAGAPTARQPGISPVPVPANAPAAAAAVPPAGWSTVAEKTIDATVLVQVQGGHGSGFIVAPEGLVVTACHVLDSPWGLTQRATLRLNDGRERGATLLCAHRPLDFALLWIDEPGSYPALAIGPAKRLRYAQTVMAVGHPGVGGRTLTNTVSTGIVANPACTHRGIEWIQMTTDIDPGNSGGPLVNEQGEAIGINCWKFTAVAAAKMALPLDYLSADLTQATARGRGALSQGHVCTICGSYEAETGTWFCRTCGSAHHADQQQGRG